VGVVSLGVDSVRVSQACLAHRISVAATVMAKATAKAKADFAEGISDEL